MKERLERKFVLVFRHTRLREMVARHSTRSQARFRAAAIGADWTDIEREHTGYEAAVDSLRSTLDRLARVVVLEREFLPTHVFGPKDVLVCVGQDGLVANCLKYTQGQYVLGVNPAPARFDGVLLGWRAADLQGFLNDAERALDERLASRWVSMAEAQLADGQTIRAVNDLYIGLRDHGSSRYQIAFGEQRERQSSSGILVTTGLGSTGWLKSVVTTASAVSALLDGRSPPGGRTIKLAWDAPELVFSVREAFPSRWTQAGLVFGRIPRGQSLVIESDNPENCVIFSDGMQRDALEFNSPQRAEIHLAAVQGRIGWPDEPAKASKSTRKHR
jgi:NAD kinase